MSKIAKRVNTELTRRLDAMGITQDYLGKQLGRCGRYVGQRLNREPRRSKASGRYCWTSEEAWRIMEILNAPDEDFPVLFPPDDYGRKKGRAA